LLRQIFEVDPLACPQCHGTMRILAVITQASVIDQILAHLRTRADVRQRAPRRSTRPEGRGRSLSNGVKRRLAGAWLADAPGWHRALPGGDGVFPACHADAQLAKHWNVTGPRAVRDGADRVTGCARSESWIGSRR
jgi:hypothetical protein